MKNITYAWSAGGVTKGHDAGAMHHSRIATGRWLRTYKSNDDAAGRRVEYFIE